MPAPLVAALPTPKPEVPERAEPAPQRQAPERKQEPARTRAKPEAGAPKAEPAPQHDTSTAPAAASQAGGWDALQRSAAPQGAGGTAEAGAHSASDITSARQEWLAKVRSAVQREKRYPLEAERRGVEGQSTVRIVLDAGGRLVAATLAGSSGSPALDEAAMAAVHGVGRYPPIPPRCARRASPSRCPSTFGGADQAPATAVKPSNCGCPK
jgi:periplasmic protein TonB